MERFKAKRKYAHGGEELYRNFLQNLSPGKNKPSKLALPGISDIQYVALEDIIHLQAERNYTRLFFVKGPNFLSSKTLLEYEKMLRESGFIRVHKSHLVNRRHIKSYEKQGLLKMKDGSEIEVSRRKKDALVNLFKVNRNSPLNL